MTILELLLRLTITFITLIVLARIMGRKEISQMTFFNFVSALSFGTIGASLAIDSSISILNGLIALIVWSAFTVIVGILDIKSPLARLAVEGQPRILIKNGKVMESELRKVRLDIDALSQLLRKNSVFSFTDVDYAIFETDGTLSVMKKVIAQPVTKNDMNIPVAESIIPIPTTIISDGKVKKDNLKKLHLSEEWLSGQLKSANILSIDDVFFAEVQKDGTLYIDKRKDDSQ
ncbi:YetF domain-containing protein [Oceanobacillus sp. CAU 1775]